MKVLKNYQKTVCGIRYNLFTIIFSKKAGYSYYLNKPWSEKAGDCLILKTKIKSKTLNRYTLSLMGIMYTLFIYTLRYPIVIMLYPFSMYFEGGYNFIKDGFMADYVRLFGWVNIVLIVGLIVCLILK